uniref:Uncharacterized protein n=1 Tax=Globisporangium ultimum (strain ATCC 200006 / CBS 805.95 / DAOM BR144) TaxID=431595 RepID=K3X6L1_GLOUD
MSIIETDIRVWTHPSLREFCLHSGEAAFRRLFSKSVELRTLTKQRVTSHIVRVTPASCAPNQETDSTSNMPACADIQKKQSTAKEGHFTAAQPSTGTLPVHLITVMSERIAFVKSVTELAFIIGFVVLVEYVEVIVPIIYSMYIVAVYHLANHAYCAQIATIDGNELKQTISSVLFYAGLELVLFPVITITICRQFRIPALKQVSFVLEQQSSVLPVRLVEEKL